MISSISDSPNEGATEGTGALSERYAQFVEARLDNPSQAQTLFQGGSTSIASNFQNATVGADSISFAPNASTTFSADSISFAPGIENASSFSPGLRTGPIPFADGPGPLGDAMSSVVQSTLQITGPMGLLTQLFQFLSAIFGSMLKALAPSILAQQAQGALDLKMMMSGK